MTAIARSTQAYEDWLRDQLPDAVVAADLKRKHKKMAKNAVAFLRATYWRWAETVLDVCPELAGALPVLAVGDIHLENFGTWRDADGRLVWGVNDYDEAAEMPFVLDLVRLASSALLARRAGDIAADEICRRLAAGYLDGLTAPRPLVLDRDHKWLRARVIVPERARSAFWDDLGDKKKMKDDTEPPPRFVAALRAAFPEPPATMSIARRVAGCGSLGRLRLAAVALWRGAPLVREAKALTASAWSRPAGRAVGGILCHTIATGRFRAPDPWTRLHGDVMVRRLSPNNRKIELKDNRATLLRGRMLQAMGHDLAAIHLGAADRREALLADLRQRGKRWLYDAAVKMARAVEAEHAAFKG
ncbi:MAG: DUF2252 family protein [Alphaproteobacteria bacterium]|nr:DUF2252 family protein [Alphaproteobacteria bacterium]